MGWIHIRNDWDKAGDRIKLTWGKLSELDISTIDGDREKLSMVLQDRYRLSQGKVDEMIRQFVAGFDQPRFPVSDKSRDSPNVE